MTAVLALSLSSEIEKYGAYAGIAAVVGLGVLSLLYFAQAREVKRLREWAGRAPERDADLQQRVVDEAARRTVAPPRAQPARPAGPATPAGVAAAAAPAATTAPTPGVQVLAAHPGTPAAPKQPVPATAAAAAGAAAGATAAAATPGAPKPVVAAAASAPVPTAAVPATAPGPDASKPAPAAGAPAGAPPTAATPAAAPPGGAPPVPPPAVPAAPPAATPAGAAAASPPPAEPPVAASPPAAPPRPRPRPPAAPVRATQAGAPVVADAEPPQHGSRRGLVGVILGAVAIIAVAALLITQVFSGGDDATTATQPNSVGTPTTAADGGGSSTAPQPDRSGTRVAVLNGTPVSGLARAAADRLTAVGYKNVSPVATDTTNQSRATTVVYWQSGTRREGLDVAKAIGLGRDALVVMDQNARVLGGGAPVVVIVGADQAQ